MKPRIYDHNMTFLGELRNASKVGYTRVHNDLYTATFRLPSLDSKNALCDDLCIVDIFDGDVSMGKYRLLDEPETDISSSSSYITYNAEHVISFLMNDVIDGYIELGDIETDTEAVLRRLLEMQTTPRWKLGRCDFHYNFSYSWENTNLMSAVFSIPTCFSDAYQWTYDTDTYPWTLNLIKKDDSRSCEFRRKRNMRNVKRGRDRSSLCTRLYCKGSGEGVNQVGISEVNPTGLPYIDADTQSRYGVLASHYIDLSITDPEVLYHKGLAVLEQIKHPRYTYTVKAIDLCRMTGLSWDRFDEGKIVHLIDDELNLDFDTTIIQVSKPDVDGDPLDIDVVLSNKSSDVASSIDDLANRTAIMSQYSQGATNLYSQQFADNADADHPAIMRVYVPAEAFKINQMLLAFSVSSFRAYETGAASGGATTATSQGGGGTSTSTLEGGYISATSYGGGGTSTSTLEGGYISATSQGGGGTSTSTLEGGYISTTSHAGGGVSTSTQDGGYISTTSEYDNGASVTSRTGGSVSSTSGSGGSEVVTTAKKEGSSEVNIGAGLYMDTGYARTHTSSDGDDASSGPSDNHTSYTDTPTDGGDHRHTLLDHTHKGASHNHNMTHNHNAVFLYEIPAMNINIPSHTHTISIGDHSHTVDIGAHTHDIIVDAHQHSFAIEAHTHDIIVDTHQHSFTIYDHTHDIEVAAHSHSFTIADHTHTVEIDPHEHGIVYGIYEGGTASKVAVVVDGVKVLESAEGGAAELDIVSYLAKDDDGRIVRGTWHTVELVPDNLTRIEANLFVKTFVTSHGGGNY